jgi:hypothetical protein
MGRDGQRPLPSRPFHVRQDAASQRELDDLRALVTVSRTLHTDCGQRQVVVRVDGGPKVRLVFGESFTLEVPPGMVAVLGSAPLFLRVERRSRL